MVTSIHSHVARFLRFVNHLLQTFRTLDICCAFTGTYPAFIAGVLNSYHRMRLHIATKDSRSIDSIYGNIRAF